MYGGSCGVPGAASKSITGPSSRSISREPSGSAATTRKRATDSPAAPDVVREHAGRNNLGVVDDQAVAGMQNLRNRGERRIVTGSGLAVDDQEPRRIPRLGRRLGDQRRGQL